MSTPALAALPATARSGNSLGFIRLFLATLVIYTHAYFLAFQTPDPLSRATGGHATCGMLAVQGFFVLSGCLVTTSWLRLESGVRFAVHRALRLLPAWWTCLAVTALVLGPLIYFTTTARNTPGYFAQEPSPWDYIWHNLFSPRRQIGIGEVIVHNPWGTELNGSLWTLFYEASCYALVLTTGLLGLLRRGRPVLFGLWLLLLLGYAWTLLGSAPHALTRLYDNSGKEMCLHFTSGMIWAAFPEWTRPLVRRAGLAAGAAVLLAASWFFSRGTIVSLLTLPIVLFYLSEHLPFRDWERKLRGDYSYGIYLYGYPVEQTLVHFGLQRIGLVPWVLLCLATTWAFAYLSWRWIEAPALRLKDRIGGPRKIRAAVAGVG